MSIPGAPPPQSIIPIALLADYLKYLALWGANCNTVTGGNSVVAKTALEQMWRLAARNPAATQQMVKTLAPRIPLILRLAGMSAGAISSIMTTVGGVISGLIAAAGPVLLLIIAVLLLSLLYMFLNHWWYQNVIVPQRLEEIQREKRRALSVLMSPNAISPFYTVETRQLSPGIHVPELG